MRNKTRKNGNLLLSGGGLLLALSNLSLLSVGFSSWSYGELAPTNVLVAAEVGNTLSFLSLSSVSHSGDVCAYGFIDSEDRVSPTGTAVYSYSLNQKDARSAGFLSGDAQSFSLKVTKLAGANDFLALFTKDYFSISATLATNGSTGTAATFTLTSSMLASTCSLSGFSALDADTLTATLAFTVNEAKQSALSTYLKTLDASKSFAFTFALEFAS